MLTSYGKSTTIELNEHQTLTLSEHHEEYSDNEPYAIYFEDINDDSIDSYEPIAKFYELEDAQYLFNKIVELF